MSILEAVREYIEERKEAKDRHFKAEMCMNAITAGICPKECESCAWSTVRRHKHGDT